MIYNELDREITLAKVDDEGPDGVAKLVFSDEGKHIATGVLGMIEGAKPVTLEELEEFLAQRDSVISQNDVE